MPKVLVSNNSELLRHFTAPPFQRLGLELLVAKDAGEARALFKRDEPSLVVLDAETDGFAVAKAVKEQNASTRVILVSGKRLSGDQMREVQACGCDELLIAPMTADELHDVIAIQLGEPRPGTEAFAVQIAFGETLGGALGPQIGGAIADVTGDLGNAMVLYAALPVVALFVAYFLKETAPRKVRSPAAPEMTALAEIAST